MQTEIEAFFDGLRAAPRATLVVDYDGTLAPFAVERDAARPYPRAAALLRDIAAERSTRVVVLSGRALGDLLPLISSLGVDEVWGSHGWERSVHGRHEVRPLDASARAGLDEARRFADREGLQSLLEPKPVGLAFHWRGRSPDEIAALQERLQRPLQDIADAHGLLLHAFDGGLELRAPGHDKGTALAEIVGAADDVPVAYLGDDLTDEDAFEVLRGKGLGVLVRPSRRPSAASAWIVPPDGLYGFLEAWLESRRHAAREHDPT